MASKSASLGRSGAASGMMPWLALALLILILDQLTKALILGAYRLGIAVGG